MGMKLFTGINAGYVDNTLTWRSVLLTALMLVTACEQEAVPGNRFAEVDFSGDPGRSERLISQYGCGSCHSIPGIKSAISMVGPPLGNITKQAYVGGILPNTFDNMVTFLLDPQAIKPNSAMPDVNLSPAEAEAIAAYLYTL